MTRDTGRPSTTIAGGDYRHLHQHPWRQYNSLYRQRDDRRRQQGHAVCEQSDEHGDGSLGAALGYDDRDPKCAMLQYHLARHECLLGDVEVAKARLQHAFRLDSSLRLKALEDKDLEGVWEKINATRSL